MATDRLGARADRRWLGPRNPLGVSTRVSAAPARTPSVAGSIMTARCVPRYMLTAMATGKAGTRFLHVHPEGCSHDTPDRSTMMEYVKLGRTGLEVSRICLGCMSYGAPDHGNHAWSLGEDESRPFIRRALEAGINFFDTANRYS